MYATVEQANEFISKYYSSRDSLRIAWDALSNEDKQVMLNRAEQSIDLLPYTTRPVYKDKVFPRHPNPDMSLVHVQTATIELAIHSLDEEFLNRFELQRQGVKSYKIGDLSETFGSSQGTESYAGLDSFVYSIVFPYLKDYLGGGYRICPTHMHPCHGNHVR